MTNRLRVPLLRIFSIGGVGLRQPGKPACVF